IARCFRQQAQGEIQPAVFAEIQDKAIRDVVRLQQETGLQVVTDGEFRRSSYWGRFVERCNGFEIRPAVFKFRDDHGHEVDFTATYATGKLSRTQPLAVDEFAFLKQVTKVTPKITMPAPSTMHFYRCTDFADPKAYTNAEAFFADLAAIYRQEIADLAKAGCRYIQLDEVAIAMLCDPAIRDRVTGAGQDPDKLVDLYIKAINDCVAGAPTDMVVGIHMCRGNFRGRYLSEGGYESVARALLHRRQRHPLPARVRHRQGRRLQAAALRTQDQGGRSRPRQHQDSSAGDTRRVAAAHERGRKIHRHAEPRHRSPMRIRLHRRRQSAH
ncbi:MAG: cobalamin-independent methionine synthase II family protein, partial [Sphingomonadales bacterium]|nr:cobalamin-independent methionine synthase II family protein [Sphingomonadales bacterium]